LIARSGLGENNGLARVHVGRLVSVAPKQVRPARAIHRGHPATADAEDFFEKRLQHDPFHLGQELLGRDLLAVGLLKAGEPGEGSKTRTHRNDHQLCTGDAHFAGRIDPLADDPVELKSDLVFVITG